MSEDNEKKEEISFLPDEEGSASEAQGRFKKVKEDLRRCEIERKDYLDGWQRAKADYINFKNEEGRRMEDMARFVTGGILQDFLPILDSFDLALGHGMAPGAEKGVLLIRAQFEDVLRKRGIEIIKVDEGENFNPELHEAIGEVDSDRPEGVIAELVQRGFILRGKVLRPARVRLAKGKQ